MSKQPIKLGLAGAGRMGQAIIAAAGPRADMRIAAVWLRDPSRKADIGLEPDVDIVTDIGQIAEAADVIIDFSLPAGTSEVLDVVRATGRPLVCGVSGLGAAELASLDTASTCAAIVYDRNMSLGIAVLQAAARQAAASLGPDFEIEIHETHHAHKVDAPSGTALKLGEAVAEARGQAFEDVSWYAPTAGTRPRQRGDIAFKVERRGEVPGEHTVEFVSPAERLKLHHSVTTRQVFADGALRAAAWIVLQPPGRYDMRHVLFGTT